MPPQIGDFISDAVYEGQLRSNPRHPQANAHTCFFVDVLGGLEKMHDTSYEVSYLNLFAVYLTKF